MAKRCVVCDKGASTGNTVSHSHRKTKRTWAANIQKIRIFRQGVPRRVYVCTHCLRSGKVKRAL